MKPKIIWTFINNNYKYRFNYTLHTKPERFRVAWLASGWLVGLLEDGSHFGDCKRQTVFEIERTDCEAIFLPIRLLVMPF